MAVNLDPVTLEVIRNALPAISNEMAADLQRTSYNMMIYEVRDFCTALVNAEGGSQLATALTTFTPPSIGAAYHPYDDFPAGATGDPAKTKQLLAQAGYPNGLTVQLAYDNNDPQDAAALQQAYAKAGITLKLDPIDDSNFDSVVTNTTTEPALSLFSWGADWPSGAPFLTPIFDGRDISHLSLRRMRPLRRDIQMIFQDPYSSLNPRHTVGTIVGAPFRLQKVSTEQGVKRAVQDLLELVGLNPEHYNRYPHEFSGGQRQRIGIARTLALRPKLIVADEPVSALDVSIQAQVINLLEDLQDELDLTYVMIAHDLSVVRHVSDRVAVMYLGKIVEIGEGVDIYRTPMHPYTVALMSAVPVPDPRRRQRRERIRLTGDVPSPINPPSGCRFHTRCWKAAAICRQVEPPMVELEPGHRVACHVPENVLETVPEKPEPAAPE